MACLFGHKWAGCKCTKCGKTRDEGHKWEVVDGKCMEKCAACGKTREFEHTWEGCECIVCGQTRHEPNYMGGKLIIVNGVLSTEGKCNKCGKTVTAETDPRLFTTMRCPAYSNGRCAPYGKDSGYNCSAQPNNWYTCNVFQENMKFYGYWDL